MINRNERDILRELARKTSYIAGLPIMDERREMWKRHNSLERVRPMIMVFPEGSWRELLPESILQCEDKLAREIEWELRRRIYRHKNINDDAPIEKSWKVFKQLRGFRRGEYAISSKIDWGFGLEFKRLRSSTETGAYGFDPVLIEYSDIKKLKMPEIIYDELTTMRELEETRDVLDDILDVQLKGVTHISFHFMLFYTALRGLEQMMYDLYDEPGFIHEVMFFFEAGYNSMIKQCIEQNLFSLNNDDTYHSSGGFGYSTELTKADFNPDKVRPCDMWASAESQEMAHISPEQHEEFAMQYERRMLSQFGLNGYGCCDPLTYKLDYVLSIPNMRRISISPWADVEKCAEKLKANYIFSWKPNPVYLSGIEFNSDKIREYMKHTFDATKDCIIEMCLADTHTCQNQPERFSQWVKMARELAEQY